MPSVAVLLSQTFPTVHHRDLFAIPYDQALHVSYTESKNSPVEIISPLFHISFITVLRPRGVTPFLRNLDFKRFISKHSSSNESQLSTMAFLQNCSLLSQCFGLTFLFSGKAEKHKTHSAVVLPFCWKVRHIGVMFPPFGIQVEVPN